MSKDATSAPDLLAPASATPSAASHGYLLNLFRTRPGWTRQQLLEVTGVSRTTLYDRLDTLFQAGLIYSAGSVPPPGGAGARGRRSELLRFDDRGKIVLVLDLGQTSARVCVVDVHGQILRMSEHRLAINTAPAAYFDTVFEHAHQLVDGRTGESLVGVALGIPGPVDSATGVLGRSTTMPLWQSFPVMEAIREHWQAPVVIENDARALAIGEASVEALGTSVLAVKYSTGIGAGIVVDGRVLVGSDGAAGDIGHIRLHSDGPPCTCGRRGCLAAYASGDALVRTLAHAGVQNLGDVVDRAQSGDPEVREALREAVSRLSRVLASIITAINPDVLVVGGSLGRLRAVVEQIDEQVHADVVDRAVQRLQVTGARLGDRGTTTGLARRLVDLVYAPHAVDLAVARRSDPGSGVVNRASEVASTPEPA
ncbi:ROK family protein [Georgenia sp. H159]|uniref:ROK family protein n=1 Tax=Georgenia sp. H159 TaxID=3076115 RepID=UPI002D76EE2A|nr:ROK family protein [Georgenia sp. H159]